MTPEQALNFLITLISQAKFTVSPNEMGQFLQQTEIARQTLLAAITPQAEVQTPAAPEASTIPNS
jgi:hypothetical protein